MKDSLFAPLSPQEEIALRRAAHEAKVPDERVVERLCSMALLQRVPGGLRLTPLGRQRYDAMAKAPLQMKRHSVHVVTDYVEGLIQKAQARNAHQSRRLFTPDDTPQETPEVVAVEGAVTGM